MQEGAGLLDSAENEEVRAELVFWRHRCSSDSSVPLRCLQEYQVVDQPTPDTGTFEELLDLAVPRSEPEGSE